MPARRLFWLDLGLLSVIILASRIALVLHEGLGHALPAVLLGARHVDLRLSPLGGGFVSADYPRGTRLSAAGTMTFGLGGIALNVLTGFGAWVGARRLRSRGFAYVALLFFGVGSILSGIAYLACGFYYNSGDPIALAPQTEDLGRVQWMWVLFVLPAVAVAWRGMPHYLEFLSGYVSLGSPGRRIGWMAATVGVAGLAYGALWLGLRNHRIEGSTAQWRLEREIEQEIARRSAQQAATQGVPPGLPRPAAAPAPRPAPPVVVRPEEVASRVPPPVGPIVLHGSILASLFLSAWRARPEARTGTLAPGWIAAGAAVAAGVVAAFRFWG